MCGQVRGYQYEGPDAFCHLSKGIDSYYVDGVSITYGQNPRTHIWTYACGVNKARVDKYSCPCNTGYFGGRMLPHLLLVIITTVSLVLILISQTNKNSILMILCGMVRTVVVKLPVVLTLRCLGSIEYLMISLKRILN